MKYQQNTVIGMPKDSKNIIPREIRNHAEQSIYSLTIKKLQVPVSQKPLNKIIPLKELQITN